MYNARLLGFLKTCITAYRYVMSRFRFDSRRVEVQVQYNLPGAITYFIVYACIRARKVKSLFYIKKTLKS